MTGLFEGSNMILQAEQRFNGGAFADIFKSQTDSRVYKLFKRRDESGLYDPNEEDREYLRRAVCESEISAYKLLQQDSSLSVHAPNFFGQKRISNVINKIGQSILKSYLPDCCYCIEFVDGNAEKLFKMGEDLPIHLKQFIEKISSIGIHFTRDASIFFRNDPGRFCIIDFGIEDRHKILDNEIAFGDGLTQANRDKWALPLGD